MTSNLRAVLTIVVKLQAHEDYLKGWNLICDVSRKEFQKVCDRLDIKILERG
jgi:arginyl-tRNA synthetase